MKRLLIALSLLVVPLIAFSAIAGGGKPGIQLAIRRRQIVQVGLMHNVPEDIIKTPEQAADIIANGGRAYVSSIGAVAMAEVSRLLSARGVVD